MLPNSGQQKEIPTDETEHRDSFTYQPDCSLDTAAEKEENEAHLDAHPGEPSF